MSRRSRAVLEGYGIAFQNRDLDGDPDAARLVTEWNHGNRTVPTIAIRLVLVEPSAGELSRVLESSGATIAKCTAYTTTWCPDCHMALAWLHERQVACTVFDVEQDLAAAERARQLNSGRFAVPVLDLELRLVEPEDARLEAALGLVAAR